MSLRKKVIRRHLARVAKRAIGRIKLRKIVRRGNHVKGVNYVKPHFGPIMLA